MGRLNRLGSEGSWRQESDQSRSTIFIAEIGANHDGSLDRALNLVRLAADSGANAVKFQHIRAKDLGSTEGFDRLYREFGNKSQHSVHAMDAYKSVEIPVQWMKDVRGLCDDLGVDLITAPYYLDDIEELAQYVDAFKVGSGDFRWIEKNERLLATGKPLILATGMESLWSIQQVVSRLEPFHSQLTLLQCNSNYSASIEILRHLNLNVIQSFRDLWPDIRVGLSDHTRSVSVIVAAVALGASVIERHFTDDNTREGADHFVAMDPLGWESMISQVREVERALGSPTKKLEPNEAYSSMSQRRAVRAARGLQKGDRLKRADITLLRPWLPGSLDPIDLDRVVGSVLTRNISAGEELRAEDIGQA